MRALVPWIERALLLLAAAAFSAHVVPRAWATVNTDFPNYYVAARLAHEGYDTSRIYEWAWFGREKDHRGVDAGVVVLLPITPFSTLALWPLTGLGVLAAKHVWILLNLALLIPIAALIRSMTGLSYQRIALVILLTLPLRTNLLYGQFYVLLLLLLTAACFSYLRGRRALAGALVAVAAAAKIFPLVLFLLFLVRRDWRALLSGTLTMALAVLGSIAVFGLNAHRTWLEEILPWVLRGEALPPYDVQAASFPSIFHYLFLSEPQLNPHPWHDSPLAYALLTSLVPVLLFAPALLLLERAGAGPRRILLEWSALITASLAVSTCTASYDFVLMILPACVVASILLEQGRFGWLAALIATYAGIGVGLAAPTRPLGPAVLLYVPRLLAMVAALCGCYALLLDRRLAGGLRWDRGRTGWAALLAAAALLRAASTYRVEAGMRAEYPYRLPLPQQGLLNSSPQQGSGKLGYVTFDPRGYYLVRGDRTASPRNVPWDLLSFTGGRTGGPASVLYERASHPGSEIVALDDGHVVIRDGRDPVLSADGRDLAFLRDDRGRGQLLLVRAFGAHEAGAVALTPPELNVYEGSLLSPGLYAFSAIEGDRPPRVYLTDRSHRNEAIGAGGSRYPALSPDGRWLIFSRLEHGVWNLWLRGMDDGATRRIADVPCNQIGPAWESDSKTIVYGTDCGRSVWLTALARRRVIP